MFDPMCFLSFSPHFFSIFIFVPVCFCVVPIWTCFACLWAHRYAYKIFEVDVWIDFSLLFYLIHWGCVSQSYSMLTDMTYHPSQFALSILDLYLLRVELQVSWITYLHLHPFCGSEFGSSYFHGKYPWARLHTCQSVTNNEIGCWRVGNNL